MASLWADEPWQRALSGLAIATAMGLGKEALDAAGMGQPSWADVGANLMGALLGAFFSLLVDTVQRDMSFQHPRQD